MPESGRSFAPPILKLLISSFSFIAAIVDLGFGGDSLGQLEFIRRIKASAKQPIPCFQHPRQSCDRGAGIASGRFRLRSQGRRAF
jgi:hypothetical protein